MEATLLAVSCRCPNIRPIPEARSLVAIVRKPQLTLGFPSDTQSLISGPTVAQKARTSRCSWIFLQDASSLGSTTAFPLANAKPPMSQISEQRLHLDNGVGGRGAFTVQLVHWERLHPDQRPRLRRWTMDNTLYSDLKGSTFSTSS